jgi:pimeloyl-ACP methyl ester carboxylesterase
MSEPSIDRHDFPKLHPREKHFRIAGPCPDLALFLRHVSPEHGTAPHGNVVLYVHGATFPSALSIAHRFDGCSWQGELAAAGFHCWGLDFHGFGFSDPYPQMAAPAAENPPLGRAVAASRQLECAVRFIAAHHDVPRISLIAHSWGSIVAGRFAGRCPELVERMVFFGPLAQRPPRADAPRLPAWQPISLQYQWDRFVADVPRDHPPVLLKCHFAAWGEAYLDSDADSRRRLPAAVNVPCGPFQDIADAWSGALAYDPGLVRCPVAIVRGAWDSLCGDDDAKWLFDALSASPMRRDIKIDRGTHLMHLEESRYALYRETRTFLAGEDGAPAP